MDIFEKLLKPTPLVPVLGLTQWEERHRAVTSDGATPIEQAFLAGMHSDRLGYAFASGHQIAINAVLGPTQGQWASLAITEEEGASPKDLECEIREGRLFGKKTHVTMAPSARVLWVLVKVGLSRDGENVLRLVKLRLPHDDVEVRPLEPSPFIPEIPNAEAFFEGTDVVNEPALSGDVWNQYVKPFGVAEALFTHAAYLGWFSQVMARAEAPAAWQEELLVYATSLKALSQMPLSVPTTQLALEGVLTRLEAFMQSPGAWWEDVDAVTLELWKRDRPVFSVAARTRSRRREAAWKKLHAGSL